MNDKGSAQKVAIKELNETNGRWKELNDKSSILEQDSKSKDEVYLSAKTVYEKVELGTKKQVQEIRHQLTVGDECPVCGQQIHILIKDEDFVSQLEPLKVDLEQKLNAKQAADASLKAHQTQLNLYKELVVKSTQKYKTAQTEYDDQTKIVITLCTVLNIECELTDIPNKLAELQIDRKSVV